MLLSGFLVAGVRSGSHVWHCEYTGSLIECAKVEIERRVCQIGADNQFGKDFNHPDPTTQGTIVRVIYYVLTLGAFAHCGLLSLRYMYVEEVRRSGRQYFNELSKGPRMRRRKSNDVFLGREYWEKTHDHVWCDYNVGRNGENCSFPCSYACHIS